MNPRYKIPDKLKQPKFKKVKQDFPAIYKVEFRGGEVSPSRQQVLKT